MTYKPNPKDKKDKDGANDEFNASKAEDKIDFSKLDVHRSFNLSAISRTASL